MPRSVGSPGRRDTLALLARTLREHGPASRARLAVLTGLPKATVSTLVVELARRGLVRVAGRVELLPRTAFGIGVEVRLTRVVATAVDLDGGTRLSRQAVCEPAALRVEEVADRIGWVIAELSADVRAAGGWVCGITVVAPGLIDTEHGVVRLAPRLRWREVALLDTVAARTGLPLELLALGNDANLAALAEHRADPVPDLLCLVGDHGVGAGVVADGVLVRGASGYAGEVGHMALEPLGPYCACGRRGCWEACVGFDALLHAVAAPGDPLLDPALDAAESLAVVRARASAGDWRALDGLHRIGAALGTGVAILATLLNPTAVVLGGYFAALAEWLVEPVRAEVAAGPVAAAAVPSVRASALGASAAGAGGALLALERAFDDPARSGPDHHDHEEAPA
ncbi:ROK family transcriptional regulator [Saccharothrix coeruleofusca]|uniref:Transcriptional regulator n=1 Tax=Saccharothrix coeruleofusca TaxID=33919 RepID=A0A918EGJ0_9PSEU|nr:ROK family transcriptional regulator [Saccharothrix coeruleofusca]MBP2335080.1 putative NBD/HSP70 family sugar kinase [Saccharothrix coeruleofusca]GGP68973.1 transcriptional regulator [Saccharothrix coeruleofusca]